MTRRLSQMHMRVFDTLKTNLATNTALGTATRHEYDPKEVHFPEQGKTFKSCRIEVRVRDSHATAIDPTKARIEIVVRPGSGIWHVVDSATVLIANTGDHQSLVFTRDVTAYMNNTGGISGIDLTDDAMEEFQVAVTFETNVAANVNNITAKLIYQYEYDQEDSPDVLRTATFPIASHHSFLTTAHQTIGLGSGCPIKQIPAIGPWISPSAIMVSAALELEGSSGEVAGNVDHNMFVQIDASGEDTRATMEQALGTNTHYYDAIDYDHATHSINQEHLVNLRGSVANNFPCTGGRITFQWVEPTDEVDFDSNRILNHVTLGIQDTSYAHPFMGGNSTTYAVDGLYEIEVDIQEPGDIELVRSGIELQFSSLTSGLAPIIQVNSETPNTYTPTWASANSGGSATLVHPFGHDQGSAVTRSAATSGSWDADAVSQTFLGDGYVECVARDILGSKMIGLSADDPDASFTGIDYCLHVGG